MVEEIKYDSEFATYWRSAGKMKQGVRALEALGRGADGFQIDQLDHRGAGLVVLEELLHASAGQVLHVAPTIFGVLFPPHFSPFFFCATFF